MSASNRIVACNLPVTVSKQPYMALLDSQMKVLHESERVSGCPFDRLNKLRGGDPSCEPCFKTEQALQVFCSKFSSRTIFNGTTDSLFETWECHGCFIHYFVTAFDQDGGHARTVYAGPFGRAEQAGEGWVHILPRDCKPKERRQITQNIPILNAAEDEALQLEMIGIARTMTCELWDYSKGEAEDIQQKVNSFYGILSRRRDDKIISPASPLSPWELIPAGTDPVEQSRRMNKGRGVFAVEGVAASHSDAPNRVPGIPEQLAPRISGTEKLAQPDRTGFTALLGALWQLRGSQKEIVEFFETAEVLILRGFALASLLYVLFTIVKHHLFG